MDPRLADHAQGIELQLIEMVEELRHAEVQGRLADAAALRSAVDALQNELAETVDPGASSAA